jgi:hypothetical protein
LFARTGIGKKKSATPRGCAESTPKEEGGGDTEGSDVWLQTTRISFDWHQYARNFVAVQDFSRFQE